MYVTCICVHMSIDVRKCMYIHVHVRRTCAYSTDSVRVQGFIQGGRPGISPKTPRIHFRIFSEVFCSVWEYILEHESISEHRFFSPPPPNSCMNPWCIAVLQCTVHIHDDFFMYMYNVYTCACECMYECVLCTLCEGVGGAVRDLL